MKPVTISKTADGKYWIKKYEFEGMEAKAKAVALMPDGDIVIAGRVRPKGDDTKPSGLVARLDREGNVKWVRILGGNEWDKFNDVKVAPNGDVIVAGFTESFGVGDRDFWVLRLDENGKVKWQKTYGGERRDEAYAVAIASNGDIIVVGYTWSFGAGYGDAWVLRLDENGNVKWQKTYGGFHARAVAVHPNGDIIVVGAYSLRAWLLRLDSNGNVKWQKAFSGCSSFSSLALTPESDIIAVGGSMVAKIPADGNFSDCDLWKDTDATVMDTQAVVKNTRCKVKKAGDRFSRFKISNTAATVRTAMPKVTVLCEWTPEVPEITADKIVEEIAAIDRKIARLFEEARKTRNKDEELKIASKIRALNQKKKELLKSRQTEKPKPCPGYLINGRCYIVKAIVMDEVGLKSALEELDKELRGIDIIQPLPDEITVHPFKGIVEGENLFVTRSMVSRGPGESGIAPSKWLVEILDWIRNTVIPEIEVPEKVSRGLMEKEAEAKTIPKISEVPRVLEKAKPVEDTKTPEGFPSALLSRYEPLEFLGEGGFAKVFKVKRRKDGKIVALKIPRIDEKTSKTFIREVSTWLHLDHPNIVRLYDVDILPIPYLEMEYVEGVELNGEIIRDLDGYPKPLDEKTALKLIRDIAEGLKHAHSKRIYHRDLKPQNILLKADLTPKITDWGLAKIGTATSGRMSSAGYSPLYAAPEHLMPSRYGHTDARTDIWQLGVTFYELLTGKLPFEGYTYEEVFGKIVDEKYHFTPPSKINPELAKYDSIFEKLLAKRKEERYRSVDEFLKDLEKLSEAEKRKAELEKEIEELKMSLAKSIQTLKQSKSTEEIIKNRRMAIESLGKLALAYAELNRKAELLNTLNDLKFYTIQNLSDLTNAINTVEMFIRENLPVNEDFIERLKVLVHNIKRENR